MTGSVLALVAFFLVAGSTTSWFLRIRRVQIPADRRGFVACWVVGVALAVLALVLGAGWVGGILAGLTVVSGAVLSALVYVSPQKVADAAIRVGERLRDFTAPDENGAIFSLADFAGKPLLLKFFRGHW